MSIFKRGFICLFIAFATMGASKCQTPGLEEPAITECFNVDNEVMECHYPDGSYKDVPLVESIGYFMVDPQSRAKIKTHHEVMHQLINKKR